MRENKQIQNATDPHLFFTFNGFSSREWNLFIENTNKGGGTKVVTSPDKTVSFTSPDYGDATYYLGTTKKQKTFKHTLAADGLTEDDLNYILNTLKIGQTGFLVYDTNPHWGWDVVVTNVGDVTKFDTSYGDMIVEFDVEFKTYGDWRARSLYPANWEGATSDVDTSYASNATNEYGIPEILHDYDKADGSNKELGVFYLPQVTNEPSILRYSGSPYTTTSSDGKEIRVINLLPYKQKSNSPEDKPWLYAQTDRACTYHSDLGVALVNGTDFLEEYSSQDTIVRRGLLNNELPQNTETNLDGLWYKCEVYYYDEGTKYNDGKWHENKTKSSKYSTKTYVYNNNELIASFNDMPSSTSDQQSTPAHTYYGKCNKIQISGVNSSTIGNQQLTIIKYKNI